MVSTREQKRQEHGSTNPGTRGTAGTQQVAQGAMQTTGAVPQTTSGTEHGSGINEDRTTMHMAEEKCQSTDGDMVGKLEALYHMMERMSERMDALSLDKSTKDVACDHSVNFDDRVDPIPTGVRRDGGRVSSVNGEFGVSKPYNVVQHGKMMKNTKDIGSRISLGPLTDWINHFKSRITYKLWMTLDEYEVEGAEDLEFLLDRKVEVYKLNPSINGIAMRMLTNLKFSDPEANREYQKIHQQVVDETAHFRDHSVGARQIRLTDDRINEWVWRNTDRYASKWGTLVHNPRTETLEKFKEQFLSCVTMAYANQKLIPALERQIIKHIIEKACVRILDNSMRKYQIFANQAKQGSYSLTLEGCFTWVNDMKIDHPENMGRLASPIVINQVQQAKKKKARKPGKCFGCGEKGHFRAMCPNKKVEKVEIVEQVTPKQE